MTKIYISEEEWWPVYVPEVDESTTLDIPQIKLDDWLRVFGDFNKVQSELKALLGR
jgi:hypothetical protein